MEISPGKMSGKDAQLMFQQILSFPLQGVCKVLKRIGGQWLDYSKSGFYKQVDGDKYICMDNIVKTTPCLVYSFGIKDDWTFEDEMDRIGCTVHAYDHTIDAPSIRGHRIAFHKLGLGTETNMDTLDNIIRDNDHTETSIQFLKVWLYFFCVKHQGSR